MDCGECGEEREHDVDVRKYILVARKVWVRCWAFMVKMRPPQDAHVTLGDG